MDEYDRSKLIRDKKDLQHELLEAQKFIDVLVFLLFVALVAFFMVL